MTVRGIRGATVAERDEADLVLGATRELLQAILDFQGRQRRFGLTGAQTGGGKP